MRTKKLILAELPLILSQFNSTSLHYVNFHPHANYIKAAANVLLLYKEEKALVKHLVIMWGKAGLLTNQSIKECHSCLIFLMGLDISKHFYCNLENTDVAH